jgi:hypothetical protein
MSQTSSSESHQDEVDAKLMRLRKATIAVEKLLYGELANSALKAVIKPHLEIRPYSEIRPDWNESKRRQLKRQLDQQLKLRLSKLEKLTKIFDFDCLELAKILTTRAKLVRNSKPIQDAARWLIGLENNLPPNLQNPAGFKEIDRAANSGDTKFFISLGECLRDKSKPDKPIGQKNGEVFPNLEYTLAFYWHPNPKLNWPGLAYCTDSARWDFLEIHSFRKGFGENYLGNLARGLELASSRKSNRFVSSIKVGKNGLYRFS